MEDQISRLINHLQHIGIPVTNVVTSEQFYNKLGFSKVMQSEFKEDCGNGTCVMMKNKGIILELYQFPQQMLQEVGDRKDGHIDHITFDVDDIELTFNLLKQASFNVIELAPVFLPFWENGCKYFNILGPDSERLEFNQLL